MKSCLGSCFRNRRAAYRRSRRIELANAVATLSGQVDAFENVRKSLGVDSLDISSSATGGALVSATRAINDRVSVGVTTGARPQDNGVNLNYDVNRHVRLQVGVRLERRVERRHRPGLGVQVGPLRRLRRPAGGLNRIGSAWLAS